MTINLALGGGAFLGAIVCAVSVMNLTYKIVFQVNSKIEPENHFGLYGWWIGKYLRLRREYRRLYPHGNLAAKVTRLEILFGALMLVVAWALISR